MITIYHTDHTGGEEYRLRIKVDQRVVCDFVQPKPYKLTECLHRAADAVEISNWVDEVLKIDAKGG